MIPPLPAKFVHAVRSQENVYLCGGHGKQLEEAPGGHLCSVNVLFPDVGAGYTDVFTWSYFIKLYI